MPRYAVLMTTESYIEVEADNAKDAEIQAFRMYQRCEIAPDYPIFNCDEEDLLED